MNSVDILQVVAKALMILIPILLSLTVHEFSHAFVARQLGDKTAERAGRLTLNPVAHADMIGTIIMPMSILMLNGISGGTGVPFFGWAKPVPVDASQFHRHIRVRFGTMLVAAAGPLSNLLLSIVCAGIVSICLKQPTLSVLMHPSMYHFMMQMVFINVGLCVFNFLPIGALDGHAVVSGLLSTRHAVAYDRFNQQYGSWLLLGLIIFAQALLSYPIGLLTRAVLSLVGLI